MKERCLMCMCWHEPGEHVDRPVEFPETLTGQVPVVGTCDDDA